MAGCWPQQPLDHLISSGSQPFQSYHPEAAHTSCTLAAPVSNVPSQRFCISLPYMKACVGGVSAVPWTFLSEIPQLATNEGASDDGQGCPSYGCFPQQHQRYATCPVPPPATDKNVHPPYDHCAAIGVKLIPPRSASDFMIRSVTSASSLCPGFRPCHAARSIGFPYVSVTSVLTK